MLDPSAALRRILDEVTRLGALPAERVPSCEAVGRALAEDLRAAGPLPPFTNSQMDGYALRAADAPRPGTALPVAFEVYAGGPPPPPLPVGKCARVFTGAPLPEGADCIEMQEEVVRRGGAVRLRRAAEVGRFVRWAGQDLAAGEVALAAGAVLDLAAIGAAAALGALELSVRRRPRVAILATGDELVPAGDVPRPGQLRESNGHALAAAVRDAGGAPALLAIARDDRAAMRHALAGARGSDVLLTVGGTSVGERDLVRVSLREAGAVLGFWRVAMRPGKPIAFGRWGDRLVFALPGNPVSALVTFELFVRPALRALAGLPALDRVRLPARLASGQRKPAELTVYLRARTAWRDGALWLEPLSTQGSGDHRAIVGTNALGILPAGLERLASGAPVEAILLR